MAYLCVSYVSRSLSCQANQSGRALGTETDPYHDKEKRDYLNDPRTIHFIGNIPLKTSAQTSSGHEEGDYKLYMYIYMDSIQTYKRIMDGAGIYPGPICQILNLLYSFFSSFMMVHDLPYHTKKIGGKNEASQVGF